MKKGDIVSVDFPFTDLSGTKRRPALFLTEDGSDATLAFITTQTHQARPADVPLIPSRLNGLKLPSVVRTGKFATLNQRLIHGKLGEISPAEIVAVDAGLVRSLDIKFPV